MFERAEIALAAQSRRKPKSEAESHWLTLVADNTWQNYSRLENVLAAMSFSSKVFVKNSSMLIFSFSKRYRTIAWYFIYR